MLRFKRYIGAAVLLIGMMVTAFGGLFVAQGWNARNEVKAALADEQVYATIDEQRVLVDDQAELTYQANVIKGHTLGTYGAWQDIPRTLADGSENPDRQSFLNGLTLRTSLYLGRVSLEMSNLVIALGAIFLVIGTALATAGVVLVGIARFVTQPGFEPAAAAVRPAPAGGAE
jgi:hypothetical protein